MIVLVICSTSKRLFILPKSVVVLLVLISASWAQSLTELYLVPHTHADVGWLQTTNSLSRVNVSRILDGVTGSLSNDTARRRRFVWDEMAFLQYWWDNKRICTSAQRLRSW